VFVSKTHPVIDLLRLNKDILNADIDSQALIDDQWLKVTKQVMSTCCQQLKTKVLSKVGTCDLNQLSVQLSRMDGIHWVELSENDELFSKIPAHLTTQGLRNDTMSEEQSFLGASTRTSLFVWLCLSVWLYQTERHSHTSIPDL
jgi:hypothetical protein